MSHRVAPSPPSGDHPRRRPGGHRPARLTRRGRAVVVLVVAVLLLLAFSLGRVAPFASTSPQARPSGPVVVVQPGDTLWGIAAASAPSVDPRVTIERIIDLNGLPGAAVRAGQSLVLPRAP
jgi:hypothetical protein